MVIGPAYGRQYKSAKDIKADWLAGRDFIILDVFNGQGRYVNRQDCPKGEFLEVRYGKHGDKVTGFRNE